MKIHRPVASVLFAFVFSLAAFAEDNSEIASLRAKAMKGNGVAQYNLGLAYAEGHGLPADPLEAFVWLSLARENGARGRALDTLVASFDKAAFAAAEQRLAEHKADPSNKTSRVKIARTGSPAPVPAAVETKPAPAAVPVAAPSPPAAPAEDPALTRLRTERDALAVRVNGLANELAALRAEHELLAKQSAAGSKAALEKKTLEMQAALADLESARNFGRQVEATLNKVNDQKTALEAQLAAATEASRAREAAAGNAGATSAAALAGLQQKLATAEQQLAELGSLKASLDQSRTNLAASEKQAGELTKARAEMEQQLSAATSERAALQAELAQLRQKPAAPKYPDLSGRVRELEATLADTQRQLAAKPAAPAYPDLSGKVGELETQLAKARKPAPPAYPDLRTNLAALEAQLATAATEAGRTREQMTALTKANTEAQQALAAKPSYPDLSGKVHGLETQLAEARKPVPPAYPDLSGRVHELESQATTVSVAAAASAQELADARTRLAALTAEAGEAKQQVTALTAAKTEALQKLEAAGTARASLQAELTQLREKAATPAYPDLSHRVGELEAQLAAASKPAAPANPDLSGRVQELE